MDPGKGKRMTPQDNWTVSSLHIQDNTVAQSMEREQVDITYVGIPDSVADHTDLNLRGLGVLVLCHCSLAPLQRLPDLRTTAGEVVGKDQQEGQNSARGGWSMMCKSTSIIFSFFLITRLTTYVLSGLDHIASVRSWHLRKAL